QFTLHPQPWFTFIAQYHRFYLANTRDFLYNAAGLATLRDPTGQSGSHVGDEIDFRVNVHVSRHQDVLFGYSKLFAGDFLRAQRPGISPDFFYAQYVIRF
ncbi:MAG TPA: alginate export family protein, partial [Nitrosomonas sp.]|nr:alginate export family protein [Nitrosomonas sp.]